MNPMTPSPDELIQAYFDGTITAEEEQELRRWLEADEANLDDFVRQVELHATLWEEQVPVGEERTTPAAEPAAAPRRMRPPARLRRTPSANPWLVSLAAAVGLVAFVGIVMSTFWGNGPAPARPKPSARAKRPDLPPPAAPKPARKPVEVASKKTPGKETLTEPRPLLPTPGRRDLPKPSPLPPSEERPAVRKPPPPPPPAPPSRPAPPQPKTVPALATLAKAQGTVLLLRGNEKRPARDGAGILPETGIEVAGAGSRALLEYPDGTRVDVGPDTLIRSISRPEGKGKQVHIDRGVLEARVARQPAGRPLVFTTPHGKATVLGTTLRLTVDPEDASGTRLDVAEGRVRLTRTSDGRSVLVSSGHFAVAAAGSVLKSQPIRRTDGLLALYTFRERRGNSVHDVSREGSPLNLQIRDANAVRWTDAGLEIRKPTIIESAGPAEKILSACRSSQELTVEVWVTPNLSDLQPSREPARFVTFSEDAFARNFTFEQRAPVAATGLEMRDVFQIRFRGGPAVTTPELKFEERLTHLVATRSADRTGRIYVDGAERVAVPGTGAFTNWKDTYRLALIGEFNDAGSRGWLGTVHLVAVYGRALGAEEVSDHFFAGSR